MNGNESGTVAGLMPGLSACIPPLGWRGRRIKAFPSSAQRPGQVPAARLSAVSRRSGLQVSSKSKINRHKNHSP